MTARTACRRLRRLRQGAKQFNGARAPDQRTDGSRPAEVATTRRISRGRERCSIGKSLLRAPPSARSRSTSRRTAATLNVAGLRRELGDDAQKRSRVGGPSRSRASAPGMALAGTRGVDGLPQRLRRRGAALLAQRVRDGAGGRSRRRGTRGTGPSRRGGRAWRARTAAVSEVRVAVARACRRPCAAACRGAARCATSWSRCTRSRRSSRRRRSTGRRAPGARAWRGGAAAAPCGAPGAGARGAT